ncbi:2Fe-2S iron-sulfur cluster binding domain-containing protein [Arthrobacter sp. CAU 1506]|uniref:2Fe-2S iron-sulfur cluster-binding protein n=1 Tax=Arthrobacter sp. CAU 1506 TaxID=2560052 RepID=UPI0010ACC613|nr:2Fe-2S iron-sulfur cluster-binding protein [Arthrobacter sp. CAU 1506]TJY72468.1 2Fe-2S iron-sulfur cluster binding domain-containing protein [Arthrobacter sp. CAU 1506]
MANITYHHAKGNVDSLDAEPGMTVMMAAVIHGVDGIIGECGGQAICATCHVYVRDEYLDGLPAISGAEEEMLETTVSPRNPARSRLGCQLTAGDHFNTIEVDIPDEQD